MDDSAINVLFLKLLSAAIWDKPADVTLFNNLDDRTWKQIFRLARLQSVSALIACKALSLPQECLPPRQQNAALVSHVEQTRARNLKMMGVLATITDWYEEAGFPFVLLKGLANGINYPEPLLRNPGDVDLWLYRKGDSERAKTWLESKGYETIDGNGIHYIFTEQGIHIENHRRVSYFDHKKCDRQLAAMEKQAAEDEHFPFIQLGDLKVRQLPVEMNAFFLFHHMFRHFEHLGVGFRQFCDWILFLKNNRGQIDPVSFTVQAQSYKLLYPMQVFACAAVKYLDAPPDIFPFEVPADNAFAHKVMKDVLEGGNFGFHHPGKKRPEQKMRGMWFSYKTTVRKSLKFWSLSPQHILILPATKLIHRLRIGFK